MSFVSWGNYIINTEYVACVEHTIKWGEGKVLVYGPGGKCFAYRTFGLSHAELSELEDNRSEVERITRKRTQDGIIELLQHLPKKLPPPNDPQNHIRTIT